MAQSINGRLINVEPCLVVVTSFTGARQIDKNEGATFGEIFEPRCAIFYQLESSFVIVNME